MSETNKTKKYCGGVRTLKPGYFKISLNMTQLEAHIKEVPTATWKNQKGETFVSIIMSEYKNGANQFGYTHSISIDEFVPQVRSDSQAVPEQTSPPPPDDTDLPF